MADGLRSRRVTRMHFEQFHLGCLALDSYMLASEGEAIVVDPQRDVDMYLKGAAQHGVEIKHIFETHLHADFVSGHKELAARTGAKIYIGPNGGAKVPHVGVHDGFELRVGNIRIAVLETPGHTPESICLVVTDHEKSPSPWAVLDRRYAVRRGCRSSRPVGNAHSRGAGGDALRQPA